MILESGIETCKISYMKRVTSPGLMHNTGCLGLVHWDCPFNKQNMNLSRGKNYIEIMEKVMPPMKTIVQLKFLMSFKGEKCNSILRNNIMFLFCYNHFLYSIYMAAILT